MNRIIFPLSIDMRGEAVVDLQKGLLFLLNKGYFPLNEEERNGLRDHLNEELSYSAYGVMTRKLVTLFQEHYHLELTGKIDEMTAKALNSTLDQFSANEVTYQVEGTVASNLRAAVGGLQVCIFDIMVGNDFLISETITDDKGVYRTNFTSATLLERGKDKPDLQARVFSKGKSLGASNILYNASDNEILNVQLDDKVASALQSEHETLIRTLSVIYSGKLGDLKETEDRQDVTYLANKTGWDARAVALASLADQFNMKSAAAIGDTGIEQSFFYALFRAGLPANEAVLYQTDAKTVELIWKQAIEQGVISNKLASQVPSTIEKFQKIASNQALLNPALAGLSSFKDIVTLSLGEDTTHQQQFADIYIRHREDLPAFWNAVKEAFGYGVEKRLKIDGQLAYLTLNNAPLIRKLHVIGGESGLTEPLKLVEAGFYRSEKWKKIIETDPIPPEIYGENDAEKRNRYAEYMAALLRLSYPTAVVAELANSDDSWLTSEVERTKVHDFLMEHQGKFEIGVSSIEQYAKRNNLLMESDLKKAITRMQRVYQITPRDEAMKTLLKNDVDSAYKVVGYSCDEFVNAFKNDLGGEDSARLIYAKAEQVHNAVLNVAVSYLTAKNAFPIGFHSDTNPGGIIDLTPKGENPADPDIVVYPTLERLFGELDYCACEHCRSILSPAAYLVDLLQFLDAKEVQVGSANPQTVLLERRPDIQHLPLTCENTNTMLPYIDLVNETLEYYVTNHLSLTNYLGHSNDDDSTPEHLLANPQFVNIKAYEALMGKPIQPGEAPPILPPTVPLPFHRPLEYLRRFFDKFEAPLPEVMESLRKNDNLERMGEDDYGFRDIRIEELRLSRAEYMRLTDRTFSLQQLYGFPMETTDETVRDQLMNVKAYCKRLNISYEEIIEILKTKFVNPHSTLIPKLERLGVPFKKLKEYKEGNLNDEQFIKLISPGVDQSQYGGDVKSWVKNEENFANIMSLITLSSPTGGDDVCSFDQFEFRYANSDPSANKVHPFEFFRLYRFIKLWKKLGWKIEQTDKAITAFYPSNCIINRSEDVDSLQKLDEGFQMMILRLGVIKRTMEELEINQPYKDLLELLACFAPIDTHGAASLYRQMFINSALLKQSGDSQVFADDGYGNFLNSSQNVKLLAHAPALQSAFHLTDEEFTQIITSLGYGDKTLLTIDNVSEIFRRGWLARKLQLSIREFLLLSKFTGLDPFAIPDPVQPSIMAFIKLINRFRKLSFNPVQALYLVWNQDISGKAAPNLNDILSFAKLLRADYSAIESEFNIIDDPDGQILKTKMALVYGTEDTDTFCGLLSNNFVNEVSYEHDQTNLQQEILTAAQEKIAYDHLRKKLLYKAGVMPDSIYNALQQVGGVQDSFKKAVDQLYKKTRTLFTCHPELWQPFNDFVSSNEPEAKKHTSLLKVLTQELKRRIKQQRALQNISSKMNVSLEFTDAVLNDSCVLHEVRNHLQPALDDLVGLESLGLSAQFYYRDKAEGPIDEKRDADGALSYNTTGDHRLPVNPSMANSISAIWSGYLEAAESGSYNINIEADAGAVIHVNLQEKEVELIPVNNNTMWVNKEQIELTAGTLYAVTIKAEKVKERLVVRWETMGRGNEIIPTNYLYSKILIDNLLSVYVRFLKIASLAAVLKLSTAELVFFASCTDNVSISGEGWFNSIPVAESPTIAASDQLFKHLNQLLDFAEIKSDLSPDDERLLKVLKAPLESIAPPNDLLLTLTSWELSSLKSLLNRFGYGQDLGKLSSITIFRQVYDAYRWLKKFSISADGLIRVTTNEPTDSIVNDLQATLRARYADSDWLNVLRPINDEMRSLQRNALVAYILHQMSLTPTLEKINTSDKLFEYFLMDVQMEPCMLTSRIRHALSSIQLFIERCLMNLEDRVSPASIPFKQWQWMSRYRVWEANRKVFLYPENWLEPELRDDQSPFFKETINELLQSDITEDSAATALLNYLSKLQEVAKLEPCGIHYLEYDPENDEDDIAHVVARTSGANRKYYYRRREYGYWTPWEQIKLDIEDNPVMPVVWNGRLLLFWLRILKQGPIEPSVGGPIANPKNATDRLADISLSVVKQSGRNNARVIVQAVLCWSEYYNGKWQPTKTSDVNKPALLGDFDVVGKGAFDRSALKISVSCDQSETNSNSVLSINIFGQGNASFTLYNTHSLPVIENNSIFDFGLINRNLDTETSVFTINYSTSQHPWQQSQLMVRPVLNNKIGYSVIEPLHNLQKPWDAPFFYEDSRHVFYVTTAEQLVLIPRWYRFIPVPHPKPLKPDIIIPPLVLPTINPIPRPGAILDRYGSIVNRSEFGIVDRAPIERFISENTNIKRGISTLGTVRFGDLDIGPVGRLTNINP